MKRGAAALLFHLGLQNRSKEEWQKGVSPKLLRTREEKQEEEKRETTLLQFSPRKAKPSSFSTTHSAHPAFTIVELLIVIVIIAILAAITIISYTGISNRAKNSALSSTLQSGAKKVATYALQNSNTVPADKAAFLTIAGYKDGNTTYQYTANTATTPNLFCITATQDSISYHIAGNAEGVVNKPVQGPCLQPGTAIHSGTAPTKLADGSSCPTNYILVPGSSTYNQDSFCVMKYEAKIQGNDVGTTAYNASMVPESRATGTPWVNISQTNAIAEAQSIGTGYHLMTEAEWMTIAANVLSVDSNWSTGTVGSGYIYSGHNNYSPSSALAASTNDTDSLYGITGGTGSGSQYNNKRTLVLTNGQVIWDFAGNVWEMVNQTIEGSQPGLPADTGYSWREWSSKDFQMNGLGQMSRLESVSALAAGWNSNNGVGAFTSNANETRPRSLHRGGFWGSISRAGVNSLDLFYGVGDAIDILGFRATR